MNFIMYNTTTIIKIQMKIAKANRGIKTLKQTPLSLLRDSNLNRNQFFATLIRKTAICPKER